MHARRQFVLLTLLVVLNLFPSLFRLGQVAIEECRNPSNPFEPYARLTYAPASDELPLSLLPLPLEPSLADTESSVGGSAWKSLHRKLVCIDHLQRAARPHFQLAALERVRGSTPRVGNEDFLRALKSIGLLRSQGGGNWIGKASFDPSSLDAIDSAHHEDATRIRDHQTLGVPDAARLLGLAPSEAETLLEELVLAQALQYAVGHQDSPVEIRRYMLRLPFRGHPDHLLSPRQVLALMNLREAQGNRISVTGYQEAYDLPDPTTAWNELVSMQKRQLLEPASAQWIHQWPLLAGSPPSPEAWNRVASFAGILILALLLAVRLASYVPKEPGKTGRIAIVLLGSASVVLLATTIARDLRPFSELGVRLSFGRCVLLAALLWLMGRPRFPKKCSLIGRLSRSAPLFVGISLLCLSIAWDEQLIPRVAQQMAEDRPEAVGNLFLYLDGRSVSSVKR